MLHNYYMFGTTTKLSLPQILGLWLHLEGIFFLGLDLTINIMQKRTETRKNSIKNVKRCRDGTPKSMQTRYRDDTDEKHPYLVCILFGMPSLHQKFLFLTANIIITQ